MFWSSDDDLGLGTQEQVTLWDPRDVLSARDAIVRGGHIFEHRSIGDGLVVITPAAAVAEAAGQLIAARVYVEHDHQRRHPHDGDSSCELDIRVGGWRPMTDAERDQVRKYRSGEYAKLRYAAIDRRARGR